MSNADPGRARPVFQWLAQLFALMGKESKQIIRDPSSYLVAAILPMIFLLLFGYGITLDAGVMDIVILDESNSQSGLQLQENFAHSPNFRVHQARSRSEAGRMMRDSVISGFIVIPYNFEALLVGGQGKAAVAPIQVIVSGGEPNTANFIRGYSQGVIANWQQTRTPGGTIRKQPVDVAPRYWFNPAAKSRWYLVPGSITIVMTLIGTMLTALVIAREYERGTMESLFATPVTRMQILLGKLIPYYFLGMFSMTICALAGVFLFEVPLRGSVFALFVLSSTFLMPALGQGLLISILTKQQLLAAQTGNHRHGKHHARGSYLFACLNHFVSGYALLHRLQHLIRAAFQPHVNHIQSCRLQCSKLLRGLMQNILRRTVYGNALHFRKNLLTFCNDI